MLAKILIFSLSVVTYGRTVGQGQCIGMTPCLCKFQDGRFLDLSALGKRDGTPRFLNVTDSHEITYSWNPCYSFTEGVCKNVSICAIRPALPANIFIPIGYHNTSAFLTNAQDKTLMLKYTSEGNGLTPVKNSYISLICEHKGLNTTAFKAIGQKTETSLDYYFELRGPLACVQGSPSTTPKPKSSKLSPGAEGAIIGAALVVVLGGIIGTLFALKKKGKICTGQTYDTIE